MKAITQNNLTANRTSKCTLAIARAVVVHKKTKLGIKNYLDI